MVDQEKSSNNLTADWAAELLAEINSSSVPPLHSPQQVETPYLSLSGLSLNLDNCPMSPVSMLSPSPALNPSTKETQPTSDTSIFSPTRSLSSSAMFNSSRRSITSHYQSIADSTMSVITNLDAIAASVVKKEGGVTAIASIEAEAKIRELTAETLAHRRTILELNSTLLKRTTDLKTTRNLMKNLQRSLLITQREGTLHKREVSELQAASVVAESATKDISIALSLEQNHVRRYKKIQSNLENRILDLETRRNNEQADAKQRIQRLNEEIQQLRDESKIQRQESEAQETKLRSRINDLLKELEEKNKSLNISKSDALDAWNQVKSLKNQLADTSSFMNSELVEAYDILHTKLEKALAKETETNIRLRQVEEENTQLRAYLLSEGLPIPLLRNRPHAANLL